MALSLSQVMKQSQRLIMTPQMQQSIQLLQMNSMDLEALVRDEMMENPLLELADDEEDLRSEPTGEESPDDRRLESLDDTGVSDEERRKENAEAYDEEFNAAPEVTTPEVTESGELADTTENSDGFENFEQNDVDWGEEFADSDTSSYSAAREDFEEHDFTLFTSASENLYESMRRQLRLSVLDGDDLEIAEFLIGNLDHFGYIDSTLQNQCLILNYPPELVTPDEAGPVERVDEALRGMLARLRGGENPEAFTGMKRREVIARVIAEVIGETYDQVYSMKKEMQLLYLISRQMKRPVEELQAIPVEDLLLEVIAFRLHVEPQRVFDVLDIIQEFEPTGVAARNLAECLRLQCEEKEIRNRVLYRILDGHLSDLQQKRFREIARALEVPEEKVTEVFEILARLDPKPGLSKSTDKPHYITADVFVKKVDGKYMYFLNEGDAGRLKVASNYRRLIQAKGKRGAQLVEAAKAETTRGPGAGGNHLSPPTGGDLEYASEKYKNAVWLIRNIEKRKSTILRVTEAIMEYQKEFLDKGIEHLRPLTLRDIAERVGMHESTIARVTTKKYVETPRGIFELKFFFSSGLETDDGEAASSRSIKELLTQMIEAEDKNKPLSDQKIADMLRKKGFQIARRTVAKYREQLKILPAKLRKSVR
ncbi:MAG: RNA polymerase factor sigma-54 [Candidatus Sumerlaeia bacterium]|nr:RNA polymerase factor sigma-54 [Candidatus Sumerlaeia bacterium]